MPPPRGDRAAVLILRRGKLLLLHRRKHGAVYDAVPGGTVEPGEAPEDAAVREIREETGLIVTVGSPVLRLVNQGRNESYFDARSAEGDPVLGGPEAVRNSPENAYVLGWVDLEALGGRPIRPAALGEWLADRDWTRYPQG